MKGNILLLITAAIWGSTFVAQRVGMDHLGPFTFNGLRFVIGGIALIPFMLWWNSRDMKKQPPLELDERSKRWLKPTVFCAGLILFAGSVLQQVGLIYTTAGKAGFITSLYIVIVPILGIWLGQRAVPGTWLGAGLALVGLYLLSIKADWTLSYGDFLVLIGAFFWAGHVLIIGWLAPRYEAIRLSIIQSLIVGVLSLLVAMVIETISWSAIQGAMQSILYAAILSTGIAYTLQIFAQERVKPAHAAIIMSSEAMFAVLAGWLILGELLTLRGIVGCTLILAGMLVSQLMVPVQADKPS